MASSQSESVNPLRPYYIPPSIGERPSHVSEQTTNVFRSEPSRAANSTTAVSSYSARSRELLGDLNYDSYMGEDAQTLAQNARDVINDLIWKYTSVLMAQPFEVAKTILQVRDQDPAAALGASEEDPLSSQFAKHGLAIHVGTMLLAI